MLSAPEYDSKIENVFVIGGGQVYKEAMESPLLTAIHLTLVESENIECDTFMPPIDQSKFKLWSASAPRKENDIRYSFLCYTRVGGGENVPENNNSKVPFPAPGVASRHEEYQYLDMINDVMTEGVYRGDRTGTGTYSKFGTSMRFNLRHSFPLLTTKRVFWRGLFVCFLYISVFNFNQLIHLSLIIYTVH